jgi:hypothetical protein
MMMVNADDCGCNATDLALTQASTRVSISSVLLEPVQGVKLHHPEVCGITSS